jgi:hypothetical protein
MPPCIMATWGVKPGRQWPPAPVARRLTPEGRAKFTPTLRCPILLLSETIGSKILPPALIFNYASLIMRDKRTCCPCSRWAESTVDRLQAEAILGGVPSGRAAPMYDIERTGYQALKRRHARGPATGVGASNLGTPIPLIHRLLARVTGQVIPGLRSTAGQSQAFGAAFRATSDGGWSQHLQSSGIHMEHDRDWMAQTLHRGAGMWRAAPMAYILPNYN